MKPRIRRLKHNGFNLWVCFIKGAGFYQPVGIASTPLGAYNNWNDRGNR